MFRVGRVVCSGGFPGVGVYDRAMYRSVLTCAAPSVKVGVLWSAKWCGEV